MPVTLLALNLALNAAIDAKETVAIFSVEMSAEQLVDSASDGFMTQQLQARRASPTGVVLSMKNPDAVLNSDVPTPPAIPIWRCRRS